MFISKLELEKIKSQIEFLQDLACKFQSELIALKVHQEKTESYIKSEVKTRKGWTEEAKKKKSDEMKARWAMKKSQKAAT